MVKFIQKVTGATVEAPHAAEHDRLVGIEPAVILTIVLEAFDDLPPGIYRRLSFRMTKEFVQKVGIEGCRELLEFEEGDKLVITLERKPKEWLALESTKEADQKRNSTSLKSGALDTISRLIDS